MPRRDGTGPMGNGPLTGKGMGYCVVRCLAGFGAGMGLGLGCRRGMGRWFAGANNFKSASTKTEKEILLEEKQLLQSQLEAIDKQLENR